MSKFNLISVTLFVFAIIILAGSTAAQTKKTEPVMSVSGINLGDRDSAKAFLSGTGQRAGDDGRPNYFLYNKFGTQVIKLTAASFDDPYFIMEIEVFAAGRSYRTPHTQADKIGYFETENGIFIGHRQSAVSIIVGIPGVARREQIGPKDVVGIIGDPQQREKQDGSEMLLFQASNVRLAKDESSVFDYQARYEFSKDKLRRYVIRISKTAVADNR